MKRGSKLLAVVALVTLMPLFAAEEKMPEWQDDFAVLRKLIAAPVESQADVDRIADLTEAVIKRYGGKTDAAGEIEMTEIAALLGSHPNVDMDDKTKNFVYVRGRDSTVETPNKVFVQVIDGSTTGGAAEYAKFIRGLVASDKHFVLVNDEKQMRFVVTLLATKSEDWNAVSAQTSINPAGSQYGIQLRTTLILASDNGRPGKAEMLKQQYKNCLGNFLSEKFLMIRKLAPKGDLNAISEAVATTQRIYMKYVEK